MQLEKNWYEFYSKVPKSIDYPNLTMYEALVTTANRVPEKIAWDFMGTLCTYKKFASGI